jgi:hypothetical protein
MGDGETVAAVSFPASEFGLCVGIDDNVLGADSWSDCWLKYTVVIGCLGSLLARLSPTQASTTCNCLVFGLAV